MPGLRRQPEIECAASRALPFALASHRFQNRRRPEPTGEPVWYRVAADPRNCGWISNDNSN